MRESIEQRENLEVCECMSHTNYKITYVIKNSVFKPPVAVNGTKKV
jgi:hypothetical protein